MVSREIGGYLELEDCGRAPYHEDAVALDSARSCLAYLIELRGINRIALPDLMCEAVRAVCRKAGIGVRTYGIGEDFLPVGDFVPSPGEWLYLADFYGHLQSADVERAIDWFDGRVVVDEVQGFFRDPWAGTDTFYTCRKFFGVPDGAYLVTRDGVRLERKLLACRSTGRMVHVLGRCEDGASPHYGEFSRAEEGVGAGGPRTMSEVTRRLLSAVDYSAVRSRRESNYAYLKGLLDGGNLLDSGNPEGPYMYPYLVEDARGIRGKLAERGIYVPTLWPNVLRDCARDSVAYRYAKNILPLPVDQRYGAEEMEHIVRAVIDVAGASTGGEL